MSWFILFIAGILEAGWVVGIQKSQSFTVIPYIAFACISITLSLVLFSIAIKDIPIAHAYLVWLAVGVISISIVNHYFFEQHLSFKHLLCFCLIFIGVIGLKILK